MATVSLKNVTKTYSGESQRAIEGLSLEVQDREFVVLSGPPGCGISSILRMIAGLEEASNGDIFIGDRVVNALPPKDREVVLVPQNYVPYPRLSVHDNIAFPLTLRKRPKVEVEKRVTSAAELAGLLDVLKREPKSLSDEQRQRLSIARAIALHPKVILFDEALSSLDGKAQLQLRHEIKKLHQRLQITMIYGTHDPLDAAAMVGRMVILRDGAVEQIGTAQLLYEEPANAFVAEFTGAINLVHGMLKQDRDSYLFMERDQGTIMARLSSSQFSDLRELIGGPVVLGIRPENIQIAEGRDNDPKNHESFPAIVDLVESMAGEAKLYLQTGAHTVICRTKMGTITPDAGHRSQFKLNCHKLRLFNPASHCRIT